MGEKLDAVLAHKYDLSMLSVDDLMENPGLLVEIKHYAQTLYRHPEIVYWNTEEFEKYMQKQGCKDMTPMGKARFFIRKKAETSKLERSRLNYGIQVSKNLASIVPKIEGIRAIGAEGRLGARDEERGINDLDLGIDFSEPIDKFDVMGMFAVTKDAKEKTGIEVDLIGRGIPVTENAAEHLFGFFSGPVSIKGFPLYWRDTGYLNRLLAKKNEYVENSIRQTKLIEKRAKEMASGFKP